MLILDNPLSIIIQNNFRYKKQNIIKVNSDVVTCGVVLLCMMLEDRAVERKEMAFFLYFHSVEEGACTELQEEKLINRLKVRVFQQELTAPVKRFDIVAPLQSQKKRFIKFPSKCFS